MIAIFLAPFYLILCYYILRWFYKWIGICHHWFRSKRFRRIFLIFYVFFISSPLTSFIIAKGRLHHILKAVNNYWLGILAYTLLIIGSADLIRFICRQIPAIRDSIYQQRRTFIITGFLAGAVIAACSVHGFLHVKQVKTTNYQVTLSKSFRNSSSLKVALVADLHLGYSIGNWQMKQMVRKINDCHPDLVLIAGDIFDNEYSAIQNPNQVAATLSQIKSRYGTYCCWGNHDIEEKILAGFTFSSASSSKNESDFHNFMKQSKITLLEDETICIDDSFYLVGRKDPSRSEKLNETRKSPSALLSSLDQSKPILVLDHQPKELLELANAGADLDFGGHTHDGQLFPGNLIMKMLWENPCGHRTINQMHSIVTSGIGVWGPAMRIGTDSEVVCIMIHGK